VNNIPAVVAEAKKFGIRHVIGKGADGQLLLSAIREELDARPQGIASLLQEAAPVPVASQTPTPGSSTRTAILTSQIEAFRTRIVTNRASWQVAFELEQLDPKQKAPPC
jgi:hypothetical protein